jgi:superfamily II DNA/RNA helicase
MFSATFTTDVQNLARNMVLRESAVMVSNGKWQASNHRISQNVMLVYSQKKFDTLKTIMKMELEDAKEKNRKGFLDLGRFLNLHRSFE